MSQSPIKSDSVSFLVSERQRREEHFRIIIMKIHLNILKNQSSGVGGELKI